MARSVSRCRRCHDEDGADGGGVETALVGGDVVDGVECRRQGWSFRCGPDTARQDRRHDRWRHVRAVSLPEGG